MNAIKFPGANANFTLEGCFDLPARTGTDPRTGSKTVTTMWKPTDQELASLVNGAPVALSILGGQPPVMVYVPCICPACGAEVDSAAAGEVYEGVWYHRPCADIVRAGKAET